LKEITKSFAIKILLLLVVLVLLRFISRFDVSFSAMNAGETNAGCLAERPRKTCLAEIETSITAELKADVLVSPLTLVDAAIQAVDKTVRDYAELDSSELCEPAYNEYARGIGFSWTAIEVCLGKTRAGEHIHVEARFGYHGYESKAIVKRVFYVKPDEDELRA
jgi:hypothetical protein